MREQVDLIKHLLNGLENNAFLFHAACSRLTPSAFANGLNASEAYCEVEGALS